jgi:hypothetical protein
MNKHLIDVHVLTMPGDNKEWFDKCMNSLKEESVNIQVCSGIKDDLGKARALAFRASNSNYVSWVDPDDYVLAGGFEACIDAIEKENTVAACTQEYITGISGKVDDKTFCNDWVHHLIVIKREIALKYLSDFENWDHNKATKSEGRCFIESLIDKDYAISFINKPFYVWRRHYNADSVRRRING